MLHMGHKLLHSPPGAYKIPVEVQPHHAAAVPDGPELVVGQIPPVGAYGPGVGMGRYHRAVGRLYHIPESRIRDMRHIRENMQRLHPAHEILPLFGEATFRLLTVGAAEAVGPVPHRIQQPHAPGVGQLQVPLLTVQQVGSLNAQKGRHLSLPHCFVHLRTAAAVGDAVPVLVYFPQETVMQLPALGQHSVRRRVFRVPVQGEKLPVPGKCPAAHQVDMSAVFPQAAAGGIVCRLRLPIGIHFQGCIGAACFLATVDGVTMGIKIWYFHRKFTSKRVFHILNTFQCAAVAPIDLRHIEPHRTVQLLFA